MDVDATNLLDCGNLGALVTPLPEHGNKFQRFARREILSARDELLRTNPYWRTFEASRWIVESIRQRSHRKLDPELANPSPETAIAMR